MRYVRMVLLHVQEVAESRSRAFVWFLTGIINAFVLILFWRGAAGNKVLVPGWNAATITSYYLLLTIAGPVLISHIEDVVSREDIKEGMLSAHLLRPFSYFWKNFMAEFPYKLLQGAYGIIFCFFVFIIFGSHTFTFVADPIKVLLTIIIIGFAVLISFTLRMILGICTFWIFDTRALYEAFYAVEFALGGSIIPLILLPQAISLIAYILPFSYIVYFPLAAVEGRLEIIELLRVIIFAGIWLFLLHFLYSKLWRVGIKKFSGVGQ